MWFKVCGLRFSVSPYQSIPKTADFTGLSDADAEIRVWGLGFGVMRFRVQVFGFEGLWLRVWGLDLLILRGKQAAVCLGQVCC